MSNDLVVKKNDLIEAIEDKSVSDIIKPLVNEIHLFDTFIAGTTHLKDSSPLNRWRRWPAIFLTETESLLIFVSHPVLI